MLDKFNFGTETYRKTIANNKLCYLTIILIVLLNQCVRFLITTRIYPALNPFLIQLFIQMCGQQGRD